MATYPLILTFSEVVRVADGVARIQGDLPVLAFERDSRWVCAATSAGGLEESGATLAEAYAAFRVSIRFMVEDSAFDKDAPENIGSLRFLEHEIACVMNTRDPMIERLWIESLEELRGGRLRVGKDVSELPRLKAQDMRPVTVSALPDEDVSPDTLARAA